MIQNGDALSKVNIAASRFIIKARRLIKKSIMSILSIVVQNDGRLKKKRFI